MADLLEVVSISWRPDACSRKGDVDDGGCIEDDDQGDLQFNDMSRPPPETADRRSKAIGSFQT